MGFGSYDESEQNNQQTNNEDKEGETVNIERYNGEETEKEASVDEMLGNLKEKKEKDKEDKED